VQFGTPLVSLGELAAADAVTSPTVDDTTVGSLVRAETDGTVWLRPTPGAPPFTEVGRTVAAGETLALVEVMKTFTAVRAPVAGRITAIGAADGAAVEAGAMLFTLDARAAMP
jgi:acetyl-CoA carboxylase biotin carboxyl carrier protein